MVKHIGRPNSFKNDRKKEMFVSHYFQSYLFSENIIGSLRNLNYFFLIFFPIDKVVKHVGLPNSFENDRKKEMFVSYYFQSHVFSENIIGSLINLNFFPIFFLLIKCFPVSVARTRLKLIRKRRCLSRIIPVTCIFRKYNWIA